jgi:GNAT superfamily N-acetyltransferase
MMPLQIRAATAGDSSTIARIHTDSWRNHYRGLYADRYLDGDLFGDRLAAWTERLARDPARSVTLLAEQNGEGVGFAHLTLDADPAWGTLLDNLHVLHARRGKGVGTRLLSEVAKMSIQRRPRAGLFLWVLDKNLQGIAFYESRKGTLRDSEPSAPPGGNALNLVPGTRRIRVTWTSPAALLAP